MLLCKSRIKHRLTTSPTKKDDSEIYKNHKCNKCKFTSLEPYILHQHKREEHGELLESSSPPNKKRKEPIQDVDNEIETVLQKMEYMAVEEKNMKVKLKEENKIPERLGEIMRLQGMNIKTHGLIRVGGGGKCGANCISIHTTGNENLATDIRTNINS